MADQPLAPEEALAALMSIKDVKERRDFVAEDLEGDRRYSKVDRLSLALVLEVQFGMDREWEKFCHVRPNIAMTNEKALQLLATDDNNWYIMEVLQGRMPKHRYVEFEEAFFESETGTPLFTFSTAELRIIGEHYTKDLKEAIGGEVYWSRDEVEASYGTKLQFIFSMLNRKELLGCVAGPYDDLDSLSPEDYGLRHIE